MNPTVHPAIERARAALNRGDTAGAQAQAEARLAQQADDIDALEIVGLVRQARGDVAGAHQILTRIIDLAPDLDWPRDDLMLLLLGVGRPDEAEAAARAALAANFDSPQAHAVLGTLLSERRDLPAGEWHFRRALALAGTHPPTQLNLASNLIEQGKLDEADTLLTAVLAALPTEPTALAQAARVREARGDHPAAAGLLDRAAQAGLDISLRRAVGLGRERRWAEAIALIDSSGPAIGGDALLERGRLRDKAGDPVGAWADFTAGKAKLAARDGLAYDAAGVEGHFSDLKTAFSRAAFARLPRTTRREDIPQPIFILGFPRSGTTLTEQILSSHPQVSAGGELPFVGEMIDLLERLWPAVAPFPKGLPRLWTADARHAADLLRDLYLARARAWGLMDTGTPLFTDKMPLNEIYEPLIRLAFPDARVVRLQRHPLDVAVSALSHNLTHGFHCGYRIDSLAHQMAAVHDLTQAYRAELGPWGHDLRYESLIADQEDETRRLLAALDLPFDAACLDFQSNRRFAPTPSYAQVTEPLNDRSIGRWKAYAGPLAPWRDRLVPMIADLGYEA